jgi:hypothetical protein
MLWFRSRARLGSWVALFALALQLVVSFGHVHAEHLAASSAGHASIDIALPATDAPVVPAHPDGLADDYCAICALIHLSGALLPSAAPSLLEPFVFARTSLEPAVTPMLAAQPPASFRARAPPTA